MEVQNSTFSQAAAAKYLDSISRNVVVDVAVKETEYNKVISKESIISGFSKAASSVTVTYNNFSGSFSPDTIGKNNSLPNITASFAEEVVPVHIYSSTIEVTDLQLERFELNNRNSFNKDESLIEHLTTGANLLHDEVHNDLFFNGYAKFTKGFFKNSGVIDVTSLAPTGSTPDQFIAQLISEIAQQKTRVKINKVLISRKMQQKLLKYGDGVTMSDLQKMMNLAYEAASGDLQFVVIDELEKTVTSAKPYGDIYFLSGKPKDIRYCYLPLSITSFARTGADVYSAKMSFVTSDVFVTKKYALCKATPTFS